MSRQLSRQFVVVMIVLIVGYRPLAAVEAARDAVPSGSHAAAVPAGAVLVPLEVADEREGSQFVAPGSIQPLSPLAPTVRYRFPLRSTDWWHTVNYVDLDPSPGILDWGCHAVSYDGHLGHDILIRDFVEMDEGRWVVAAAPGTVIEVNDGEFDRNTQNGNFPVNDVVVQHADGSNARYLHLAKWSTLVYQGQTVFEGQPLGLVGSSGSSTDPHLHFETQQSGVVYEPSTGACNAGTSLWKAQLPNVYLNPAAIFDAGVTTIEMDGNSLKYRPPNVTHIEQTSGAQFKVWFKISDLHVPDTLRVVWLDPGNNVFDDTGTFSFGVDYSYAWAYMGRDLPPSGSTGTWTVQLYLNGVQTRTLNFVYDGNPAQAPVATGRAVATLRGVAKGALNGSDADGDIKEIFIASDPAHGEVKIYGPRGRYFSYVADSGYAGPDTWEFQVVDGEGASVTGSMMMNVSPVLENALRLEGENDHATVPASASLNATAFTLEAWIKRAYGSSGWQGIFTYRPPGSFNFGYELFLQPDSKLRVVAGNGSTSRVAVSTAVIPIDRWTHVAATLAGTSLRVYIDGVQVGSNTFSGTASFTGVTQMFIGGSQFLGESFRGEIEEARIWNVARTPSQLASGATCEFFDAPLPSSVKGWWRFQGNVNDSSGNANNGFVAAGASFARTDSGLPLTCLVQNLDGDSAVDGLDNCPLDANNTQLDADADGVGDACDLCPSNPARAVVDSDRDGVGDRCDNCPFLGNTEQVDGDGDGTGDLCDPAPGNPALSVPADQITLSLAHNKGTGITAVAWTPGANAASYEVYRGSQVELLARFYGTCQNSRDGNTTDTAFAENEAPASGEAFYFLVVGVGSDGTRGLAGADSDGRQRDLRAKDCN